MTIDTRGETHCGRCGQALWATNSITRGVCEKCHLLGSRPATPPVVDEVRCPGCERMHAVAPCYPGCWIGDHRA
jgi:hypothetical protein